MTVMDMHFDQKQGTLIEKALQYATLFKLTTNMGAVFFPRPEGRGPRTVN